VRAVAVLCFALLLIGGLPACGDRSEAPPAPPPRAKPEVWTTFYPTTWITRQIAGSLVEVICPLPDDEDPIFWQPDAKTLQGYQAADLVIVNGAEFEKWVATASLSTARLIDTAKGFEADFVHFEGGAKHSHGPGAAHTHEGIDGHTWLDPILAIAQARAIHQGLVRILPARKADLDSGLAELIGRLEKLDLRLRALGPLPDGQHLYASHPAYNYLAKRYGWRVVNLDLDPSVMPSDEELAKIKALLAEKPGKFLLWESKPSVEIFNKIVRAVGLTSLTIEPCETQEDPLDRHDYMLRWEANLMLLEAAFGSPR
jgi:zinc transport system substrate-binding protein